MALVYKLLQPTFLFLMCVLFTFSLKASKSGTNTFSSGEVVDVTFNQNIASNPWGAIKRIVEGVMVFARRIDPAQESIVFRKLNDAAKAVSALGEDAVKTDKYNAMKRFLNTFINFKKKKIPVRTSSEGDKERASEITAILMTIVRNLK